MYVAIAAGILQFIVVICMVGIMVSYGSTETSLPILIKGCITSVGYTILSHTSYTTQWWTNRIFRFPDTVSGLRSFNYKFSLLGGRFKLVVDRQRYVFIVENDDLHVLIL